jgi:uncharacterized protein (UPF0332 family)
MNFDWEDYLILAEWLQDHPQEPGSEEASYRAATSRAYYAAFQSALEFAQGEGFHPTYQGLDHGDLRQHFRRTGSSDDVRKRISVHLNRMYDNRRQADYRLHLQSSPRSLAYYTIQMARGLLRNLEELRQADKGG